MVGLIKPPLELEPDPREVDEVFEVPLAFLLDPAQPPARDARVPGRAVGYYVSIRRPRIWGATAGMLVNLYRMLA